MSTVYKPQSVRLVYRRKWAISINPLNDRQVSKRQGCRHGVYLGRHAHPTHVKGHSWDWSLSHGLQHSSLRTKSISQAWSSQIFHIDFNMAVSWRAGIAYNFTSPVMKREMMEIPILIPHSTLLLSVPLKSIRRRSWTASSALISQQTLSEVEGWG